MTTGTTVGVGAARHVGVVGPQWSPVVTTGTTGEDGEGGEHDDYAAMEPRRDDGDDRDARERPRPPIEAAMEPRRDDGDDQALAVFYGGGSNGPQWSPVVTTGTT